MTYTEVCFKINPFNQFHEEIMIAALEEIGYDSFWQEHELLKGYIISSEFDLEKIKIVEKKIESLFTITYSYSELPDKNWNEEWEKNFQSIKISDKCIIKALFHVNHEKVDYEIIIEPKMSFGTGHHATTSLMIEQLLKTPVKNKKVLDMGCGTGILSILASKMEADEIIAVDNDKWAYENTLENISLNNTTNIKVIHGDVSAVSNFKFDIVLANINRNIIIDDLDKYKALLFDQGIVILSGFYTIDLDIILQKAKELNLKSVSTLEKNGWASEVLIKN